MGKHFRAYSLLRIKAVSDEQRIITGIASTPEPDRLGDVVEPLGITYTNPVPLLLFHNPTKPVGVVRFFPPTKDGLDFEAELPLIEERGVLRDRIEEAWQSIKARLISAVSIGFRSLEEAYVKETQSFRFLESEVLELSLVTIPANASATIETIKSLCIERRDPAASGHRYTRSASREQPTIVRAIESAPRMNTTREQITRWENTRAAKA